MNRRPAPVGACIAGGDTDLDPVLVESCRNGDRDAFATLVTRYQQPQEAQVAREVQAALLRMKPDDRVVLTLRHFSECSYREKSVILELDEKTVKSRLYEARRRLGELLKEFAKMKP